MAARSTRAADRADAAHREPPLAFSIIGGEVHKHALTHGLPIASTPEFVNDFNSCRSVNDRGGEGGGRCDSTPPQVG
jgi:hypothetical protein